MGEVIFLLMLGGVGSLYLFQTLDYKMPKLDTSGGPAMFPRIICIMLILLVALRIIQILTSKEGKKHFKFFEMFKGSTGFFSISVVVMVFLMPHLGFVVTCFLFLTIVSHVLLYLKENSFGSVRQIVVREVIFLAFVLFLYFFFTKILFVALPAGILSTVL